MRIILILILTLLIGLALYVRLAPSDPMRWHVMPADVEDKDLEGGAMRVLDAEDADFARLHDLALATPRTRVLSGSLEDGMITYVTRSAVFRFPDYTTIRFDEGRLQLFARLRFGKSDLGVNAARLDGWINALRDSGG